MQLNDIIDSYIDEVSELIQSEEQGSIFEDYEEFRVLIIRRVLFKDNHMHFLPEAFIIKDSTAYYYERDKKSFHKVQGKYTGLLRFIEEFYRNNQKILHGYNNEVEKLESFLFDRSLPSYFMDLWFDVKKDLSKIENYYYRNAIVYREFYKVCNEDFGALSDEYKDIEENIHFQISSIQSLKTRLDGLYSYHDSIKADRLNKTLLGLTVISGIFLPLNLIVGFFGMNTPGLFFLDSPKGTEKVLILLATVLLTFLLGFKIVQMADKYILRYLLGRYSFYRRISANLEDMSSRFKGH